MRSRGRHPWAHGSRHRRFDVVAFTTLGIISLLMALVLARVVELQVAPGEELVEHLDARVTRRIEHAVRGDLLDRRGRLLATTRFGERVVVDPVVFPDPPDEAIVALADAIGMDPADLGRRIITKLAVNEERAGAWERFKERYGEEPPDDVDKPRPIIRYVPIDAGAVKMSGGHVLGDEQADAVRALDLPGVRLEQRSVRECVGGEAVMSIVGKVGFEHEGLLGAERWLDGELSGTDGSLRYVRDAYGRPLWMEPHARKPAHRGKDVRLSIDLELQRIALAELRRGVEDADAAGGRLVAIDPATGEVLAMCDVIRPIEGAVPFPWDDKAGPPSQGPDPDAPKPRYIAVMDDPGRRIHPALGRNRCVEDVYEPGSTFKPFVWSSVTELGLAQPDEVFDTEGGRWHTSYGRYIEDVTKRDHMTWSEVLVNSSNIGMTKGAERLTFEQLHDAIVRFGFGSRTGIGLPGEAAGIVTSMKNWSKYTQTSVAFGYEVAVTPVQMAQAFCAMARTGELAGTLQPARLTAVGPRDAVRSFRHRVLPVAVAELTRQTLRAVAHNMERHMARRYPLEQGWKYSMFGKSGTAQIPLGMPPPGHRRPRWSRGYFEGQYNSSFIAGGPVDEPRLVVLVVIDDPGPSQVRRRVHYGSAVAGPVVRRVMERGLAYFGVEPDRASSARADASRP